jgi:large subunit ribosomal protein L24
MSAIKLKVKKGDTVIVRTGRDKGKKGEVISINRNDMRVVVKGINVVKKHTRPTQTDAGGIVQKELPIHVSNISLLDPKDGKPTKIGIKIQKDGTKVRFAKRSGDIL